jgi:hypothetical protein
VADQATRGFRQGVEERGVVLPPRPIRPQLLVDDADVICRDDDTVAWLAWADIIGKEPLLELRIQDGISPGRPGAADDQLVGADVDGYLSEDVRKCLSPAPDCWLALRLSEGLGKQTGAIEVQPNG